MRHATLSLVVCHNRSMMGLIAGEVNTSASRVQFEQSRFHLSEAITIEHIQRRAAMIDVHLSADAAWAVNRMLATSLPQRMRRQHVAQVPGSDKPSASQPLSPHCLNSAVYMSLDSRGYDSSAAGQSIC